jgi:hypothetical protein
MAARINDDLVTNAAEALVAVAESMTNEQGLRIKCPMTLRQAQSAVMAAMVAAIGYPNSVAPTGWQEINYKAEDLGK